MARYGLHLHLGAHVEKLSLQPQPQPRFNPEYDEDVADELGDDFDPHALWITKQEQLAGGAAQRSQRTGLRSRCRRARRTRGA